MPPRYRAIFINPIITVDRTYNYTYNPSDNFGAPQCTEAHNTREDGAFDAGTSLCVQSITNATLYKFCFTYNQDLSGQDNGTWTSLGTSIVAPVAVTYQTK